MTRTERLEAIIEQLQGFDENTALIRSVLRAEVRRAKSAGRKGSGKARRQINRESQARFRAKRDGLHSKLN